MRSTPISSSTTPAVFHTSCLFDSRTYAGNAPGFVARSQADFNGRVMTGASGVTPLRLPLPVGMPPIEMIKPRNGGDTPQVQSVKFAWKATWHMTVDMALLGTPCNAITTIPAGHPVPTNAECTLRLPRPGADGSGPPGRVPGRPREHWRGRVRDQRGRPAGLGERVAGGARRLDHLHHVHQRRSAQHPSRLPGGAPGQWLDPAATDVGRDRPAALHLGQLQYGRLAAGLVPGRRDHLPVHPPGPTRPIPGWRDGSQRGRRLPDLPTRTR